MFKAVLEGERFFCFWQEFFQRLRGAGYLLNQSFSPQGQGTHEPRLAEVLNDLSKGSRTSESPSDSEPVVQSIEERRTETFQALVAMQEEGSVLWDKVLGGGRSNEVDYMGVYRLSERAPVLGWKPRKNLETPYKIWVTEKEDMKVHFVDEPLVFEKGSNSDLHLIAPVYLHEGSHEVVLRLDLKGWEGPEKCS